MDGVVGCARGVCVAVRTSNVKKLKKIVLFRGNASELTRAKKQSLDRIQRPKKNGSPPPGEDVLADHTASRFVTKIQTNDSRFVRVSCPPVGREHARCRPSSSV